MLSTFDENLVRAIADGDNETIVDLLEPRVKQGSATNKERLFCGVCMLMPPVADCEMAAKILNDLVVEHADINAAIWDALRYSTLFPTGWRNFEKVLLDAKHSAVAAHMLSKVASMDGDLARFLAENRRSRQLGLFPNNVLPAITAEPDLSAAERGDMWSMASRLIVNKACEYDNPVASMDAALDRKFESHITGTRITSLLWETYVERYGKYGKPRS